MPTVVVSATFENGGEACQISIDVCEWIDQRISNAGLRPEVNDVRKSVFSEQARYPVSVGKVQFHEAKPIGFGKLHTPRLLQTRVIIGIHVVEADDVVPISQETARDVESNKASRSGDENGTVSHARLRQFVSEPTPSLNYRPTLSRPL